jgi:hypothetical protein
MLGEQKSVFQIGQKCTQQHGQKRVESHVKYGLLAILRTPPPRHILTQFKKIKRFV